MAFPEHSICSFAVQIVSFVNVLSPFVLVASGSVSNERSTPHNLICFVHISLSFSLFLFFPLSGVRCCPQLLHRLICLYFPPASVSCLLLPVFLLSCLPHISLLVLTQSSHLSLVLPRLLLPCSRNYASLFGSLSSAILSTCPAQCSLLLTSLSVKLLCTPVSSLLPSVCASRPAHMPIHMCWGVS